MVTKRWLIVGGGFSGSVLAERISTVLGHEVDLIDKRNHIAGNAHDYQCAGVFVGPYGPHIFHTNSDRVWNYLSKFTEWTPYRHTVKAAVPRGLVHLPFNLESLRLALPSRRDILNALLAHRGLARQPAGVGLHVAEGAAGLLMIRVDLEHDRQLGVHLVLEVVIAAPHRERVVTLGIGLPDLLGHRLVDVAGRLPLLDAEDVLLVDGRLDPGGRPDCDTALGPLDDLALDPPGLEVDDVGAAGGTEGRRTDGAQEHE